MDVTCSECEKTFPIAESYLGRRTRCPWCESRQIVWYESVVQPEEVGRTEGWYWRSPEGEQKGPVELVSLLELREDGVLTEEWQIWRTGWSKWYFADRLFGSFLEGSVASGGRPPRSMAHRAVAALELAGQLRHGAVPLVESLRGLHQLLVAVEIGGVALAVTAMVLGVVAGTLAYGLVSAAGLGIAIGVTERARRRSGRTARAWEDLAAAGTAAPLKVALKQQRELQRRLATCVVVWGVLSAAGLLGLVALAA